MAIVWRSYNNHARMGIDAVVSVAGNTATITAKYYLQMDSSSSTALNDSLVTLSGAIEKQLSVAVSLGAGQSMLLTTQTLTVSLTDSVQSRVLGATSQVIINGVRLQVGYSPALTVQVPARVPSKPGKPSVLRGSDTSHTISWSKSNTLTSVNVQRQMDDEAAKAVASPKGNLTSWTDTSTQSGRRYRWRVQAVSAGGSSVWSDWSDWVYTTPPKPGKPSAVRVGDDVRVSAAGTGYASSFNVQDDGVAVAADVALPWDHVAPNPAVTHRYRVQGSVSSGTSNNQVLTGPFSDYSDTVQLAAPPNAPTGLKPNGSVLVDEDVVRFSWQHNPVDSSAQTAYELRYRLTGGAWTTVSGGADSFREVTLVAGNYEFQVRTKGTHPDWSPWSATASFEVIARPTVAILLDDPVTALPLVVPWNFSQAQGKPQSAWIVELVQDGRVLESKNGSGATSSTVLSARLTADSSYEARVQVTSAGIKSEWASFPFTTVFAPPAPGIITGSWNEDTGGVDVDVQLPEPASGTVTNYAPRIEGSGTWAEVGRNRYPAPIVVSLAWTGGGGANREIIADEQFPFARITKTAVVGTPFSGNNTINPAVTAGEKIYFFVDVRSNSPSMGVSARLTFRDGTTVIGQAETAKSYYDSWGVHRVEAVVPEGATSFHVTMIGVSRPEGEYFDFRNIRFYDQDWPGYINGDYIDDSVEQPEDFRTRWLGTPNASESVMEIERVAGLPELVGGYYSDGQIRVLETATITIDPSDTIVIAPVGDDQTVNGLPVDGETHVQGEAVLSAGWWQHLGFFTGTYDGPFFDGDTGWVMIGGQPMLTKWNVDGTSTAYPPEPIVEAVLERSLNQEVWEPVTESDTDIVLTDFEARSNGSTFYRLTTFSSAGATTETIIEVVADSQKIWVNAGAALENSIWLEYENAHPAFEGGRNRANFHYSGRRLPVAYAGQAITRVIDFEGWLEPAQSIDDAIGVIQSDGAVMQYRDPNGRRVYGIISGLSGRRETGTDWHSVRGRIEESSR